MNRYTVRNVMCVQLSVIAMCIKFEYESACRQYFAILGS